MSLFNKDTTTKSKSAKSTPTSEKSMKDLYAEDSAAVTSNKKKKTEARATQYADILVKPLISEKASHQQALNQYFFAVRLDANRVEVAKAITAIYGVKPTKVTIIRQEGKLRRFGRTVGRRKDWKKAMVCLPKGKTISLYEGV